MSLVGSVSI